MERALWLTGLTTGALHSVVTSNIVVGSRRWFRKKLDYGQVEARQDVESFEEEASWHGRKRRYL